MTHPTRMLCGAALLMSSLPLAQGAISYSFATDQSSYDLSRGQSTVRVYLVETGSPSVIASDGGLGGAAFSVTRQGTNTGATILDATFNPLFDAGVGINQKSVSAGVASLTEATNIGSAGVGFDVAHPNWVYLGSLVLGVDSGSGLTQFKVDRSSTLAGLITTANSNIALDSGTLGTTTFTVAVPEPAILGLLGIAGLVLVRRRRAE